MKICFYVYIMLTVSSCDFLEEGFANSHTHKHKFDFKYKSMYFCGDFGQSSFQCENESKQHNLSCGYYNNFCWDKSFADTMKGWNNKKECYDFKNKEDCKQKSKMDGLTCKWRQYYSSGTCFDATYARKKYFCSDFKKEAKCNNSFATDNIKCGFYQGKCYEEYFASRMHEADRQREEREAEYQRKKAEYNYNTSTSGYSWANPKKPEDKKEQERKSQYEKAQQEANAKRAQYEKAWKEAQERSRQEKEQSNKYCDEIIKKYGSDGYKKMALAFHPDIIDRKTCSKLSEESARKKCVDEATEEFKKSSRCYGK